MKKLLVVLFAVVLFAGVPMIAMGATATSSHTVSIEVVEMAAIEVVGGNVTLTIETSSDPGSLPDSDTDATTSLEWTSTVTSGTRTISAKLDTAYPPGIQLDVTVSGGTSGGASAGPVTLTITDQDVFTGIGNEVVTGATLTYDASLTSMIGPGNEGVATVIYTMNEDG